MATYYGRVVYNANGGTSGSVTRSSVFSETGTSAKYHSYTINSSATPTRSGYTFLGWSSSSTATSASYQPGSSYNFLCASTSSSSPTITNLYAVWQANSKTYYGRVVYNANGGTPGSVTQSSLFTETSTGSQATHSYTINTNATPTRTGYTFLGWGTTSTTTTVSYTPGETYSFRCASTSSSSPTITNLYAVWQANPKTYYGKLYFDANGGTNGTYSSSDTKSYTGTSAGTVSYQIPDGAKCSRTAGGSQSATFSVTFNANGGSVSPSSATPSRGWSRTDTFNCFTSKSDGTGTSYNLKAYYPISCASTNSSSPTNNTIYAKYTNGTVVYGNYQLASLPTPTRGSAGGTVSLYTVTFNANGGSVSPSSANTLCSYTTTYSFGGWYTSATGGTKVTTSTAYTSATTIYAHWTPSTTYGDSLLSTLPTPTRPGYRFDGWYTSATGGTQVTTSKVYTANTTIYAHWTQITYTNSITLNPNGGTLTIDGGSHTSAYTHTVTSYDPTSNLVPSSYSISRTGYTFLGWSATSTGSIIYGPNDTISFSGTGTTLYARWTLASYTIYAVHYDNTTHQRISGDVPHTQTYGDVVNVADYRLSLTDQGYYFHHADPETLTVTGSTSVSLYYQAFATVDHASISVSNRNVTSFTVNITPAEARAYNRTVVARIFNTDLGIDITSTSHNILANSTNPVAISFNSLPAGTKFNIDVTIKNPRPTTTWAGSSTTFTKFNFNWDSTIVSGGTYGITAVEWNRYTLCLQNLCNYVGVTPPERVAVTKGDIFTAIIFNRAVTGMTRLDYTDIPSVTSGSIVYASYFTKLKNNLNNK